MNEELFKKNHWDINDIKDSLIDYSDEIKNFRNILTKIDDSFVISLEAPWGTGKSTFLDILQNQLNDDLNIIKINAWKQDYLNDPVATIMFDISNQLSDIIDDKTARNLKKIGLKLSRDLIPTIVTGLSALLPIPFLGKLINKAVESIVDQLDEQKATLEELEENLKAALKCVKKNKIIIFVDELDRCKPTYAINFLETIKHLFDINGLVFVLAFEGTVISESLKKVYGENFHSKNYLKRFINLRIDLPEKVSYVLIKKSFLDHKLDQTISKHDYYTPDLEVYFSMVYMFAEFYKLSTRDILQIINNFKLSLLLTDIDDKSIFITLFLWTLRQCQDNTYEKFLSSSTKIQDYFKEINAMTGFSMPHLSTDETFRVKVEIFGRIIVSHLTHFDNMNKSQFDSWHNEYGSKNTIPLNQRILVKSIEFASELKPRYDNRILAKSIKMVEATNRFDK